MTDPLTLEEVLALDADDRMDYESAKAGERRRRAERVAQELLERFDEEPERMDDHD